MPLFNSQIDWRGMGTIVVVGLFTLLVLAFAVISYVDWSSNAAVAEFMNATESSASDPNHSNESAARIPSAKARANCPLGKKSPPTQLLPLP
ncbi:hypothetical protein [Bradyrhizobium archetypum]|jgi:hypothetical protein|uniref:Uncharacterized protein n=1 Tax=Bradyrhizobium archetypum TaxID=2721160 RepID=A0A7Y4HCU2_9BRAD|nr:hypothetical protein [Bradyrhizobium archetypum]NOJ50937.1 hypothetical protein [Bradyrhizobium archetypum]